jgi:hypothetical protein
MLLKRLRLPVLLALLCASLAHATELSRIEWYNRGCGFFIVKSTLNYALVEHVGPGMISEGDDMVGDFSAGSRSQEVKNATRRTNMSVWIEQVFDTLDAALAKVPGQCR